MSKQSVSLPHFDTITCSQAVKLHFTHDITESKLYVALNGRPKCIPSLLLVNHAFAHMKGREEGGLPMPLVIPHSYQEHDINSGVSTR